MRRQGTTLGCLLVVDKPLGMTSHDVVGRVRCILGERRVGHAGTLDPDASGVLVLGVGQATRLLGQLTLDDKRYEARIAFGSETTTDDAEGSVTREAEVPRVLHDAAEARRVLAALEGPCEQVPPAYSAISVGGTRAYARARAGEDVQLEPRHVTIHEATLFAVEDGEPLVWRCGFHVSKGTYIRSIARDLGRSCGSAAHLCGLRRTASGCVGLERCVTLDELECLGAAGVVSRALDPVRVLGLAHHELSAYERDAVEHGRRFGCRSVTDPSGAERAPRAVERVSLVSAGRLMGVWEVREGRMSCVVNLPCGVVGVRP